MKSQGSASAAATCFKTRADRKKTGPNNFTLLRIGGIRWFITGNIGNYNFIFHD